MKIQFEDLSAAVLAFASTEKAVIAFASARVRSHAQWPAEDQARFRQLVSASDDAKFAISILADRLNAECPSDADRSMRDAAE